MEMEDRPNKTKGCQRVLTLYSFLLHRVVRSLSTPVKSDTSA
jgi:hypothetical protein